MYDVLLYTDYQGATVYMVFLADLAAFFLISLLIQYSTRITILPLVFFSTALYDGMKCVKKTFLTGCGK